jgi:primosomal replication protein N
VNRLDLQAVIVEVSPLRYTPAGLPALDLRLEHASRIDEMGQPREVKAHIRALALGTQAERLHSQALGSVWRFTGFIASPRNSKLLVFHIQDFQLISS